MFGSVVVKSVSSYGVYCVTCSVCNKGVHSLVKRIFVIT